MGLLEKRKVAYIWYKIYPRKTIIGITVNKKGKIQTVFKKIYHPDFSLYF